MLDNTTVFIDACWLFERCLQVKHCQFSGFSSICHCLQVHAYISIPVTFRVTNVKLTDCHGDRVADSQSDRLSEWKIDRVTDCHGERLLQWLIVREREIAPEWNIVTVTGSQIVRVKDFETKKFSEWQIVRVTDCQNKRLSEWKIVETVRLSDWKFVRLNTYQSRVLKWQKLGVLEVSMSVYVLNTEYYYS